MGMGQHIAQLPPMNPHMLVGMTPLMQGGRGQATMPFGNSPYPPQPPQQRTPMQMQDPPAIGGNVPDMRGIGTTNNMDKKSYERIAGQDFPDLSKSCEKQVVWSKSCVEQFVYMSLEQHILTHCSHHQSQSEGNKFAKLPFINVNKYS